MQQADDPLTLSVGTEVSAKYKGAFCEAKVSKVERHIKVKVAFKPGQISESVSSDAIEAPLKDLQVGAAVKVRHRDIIEEAVITKIQDCSQYTVVFDDGDITTLRRTALCLKSGRHFNASETLDQLPLSHPDHFGNPVVGSRRGRRRGQTIDDSSEEEECFDPKEVYNDKDANIGKVVCVETESKKREKEKWFPALIVVPSAQATGRIRYRDEYLVRSFKDGRYYTVPKRETTEFTEDVNGKESDAATQAALNYIKADKLPHLWDRQQLFGLQMSSEEDEELSSDSSCDESVEDKDLFIAQLYKFMDDRSTPLNKLPSIQNRDIDLYKLFSIVEKRGGYNRVTNQNQWKTVARRLGFSPCTPSVRNLVKQAYKKFLYSYVDLRRKLGCSMQMPQSSNRTKSRSLVRAGSLASPKPTDCKVETSVLTKCTKTIPGVQVLSSPVSVGTSAVPPQAPIIQKSSREIENHKSKSLKSNIGIKKGKHADKRSEKSERRVVESPTLLKLDVNLHDVLEGENTTNLLKSSAATSECSDDISSAASTSKRDKLQRKHDIQDDEKRVGKRRRYGSHFDKTESNEFRVEIGDKLKVYYPQNKLPSSRDSTYEAKVIDISTDGEVPKYYVHYSGWNSRYDEYIDLNHIAENISKGYKRKSRKSLSLASTSDASEMPSDKIAKNLDCKQSSAIGSSCSSSSSTTGQQLSTIADMSGMRINSGSLLSISSHKRNIRTTSNTSNVTVTTTSENSITTDSDTNSEERFNKLSPIMEGSVLVSHTSKSYMKDPAAIRGDLDDNKPKLNEGGNEETVTSYHKHATSSVTAKFEISEANLADFKKLENVKTTLVVKTEKEDNIASIETAKIKRGSTEEKSIQEQSLNMPTSINDDASDSDFRSDLGDIDSVKSYFEQQMEREDPMQIISSSEQSFISDNQISGERIRLLHAEPSSVVKIGSRQDSALLPEATISTVSKPLTDVPKYNFAFCQAKEADSYKSNDTARFSTKPNTTAFSQQSSALNSSIKSESATISECSNTPTALINPRDIGLDKIDLFKSHEPIDSSLGNATKRCALSGMNSPGSSTFQRTESNTLVKNFAADGNKSHPSLIDSAAKMFNSPYMWSTKILDAEFNTTNESSHSDLELQGKPASSINHINENLIFCENVFQITSEENSQLVSKKCQQDLRCAEILLSESSKPKNCEQRSTSIADKVLKALNEKKETQGKIKMVQPANEPVSKAQTVIQQSTAKQMQVGTERGQVSPSKMLQTKNASNDSSLNNKTSVIADFSTFEHQSLIIADNSSESKSAVSSISIPNNELKETILKLRRRTPVNASTPVSDDCAGAFANPKAISEAYSDESVTSTDSEDRLVIEDVPTDDPAVQSLSLSAKKTSSIAYASPLHYSCNRGDAISDSNERFYEVQKKEHLNTACALLTAFQDEKEDLLALKKASNLQESSLLIKTEQSAPPKQLEQPSPTSDNWKELSKIKSFSDLKDGKYESKCEVQHSNQLPPSSHASDIEDNKKIKTNLCIDQCVESYPAHAYPIDNYQRLATASIKTSVNTTSSPSGLSSNTLSLGEFHNDSINLFCEETLPGSPAPLVCGKDEGTIACNKQQRQIENRSLRGSFHIAEQNKIQTTSDTKHHISKDDLEKGCFHQDEVSSDTEDNSDNMSMRCTSNKSPNPIQRDSFQSEQRYTVPSHRGVRHCPYNFVLKLDSNMELQESVSLILKQLNTVRNVYYGVKAEYASLERRYKKMRRRDRDSKLQQQSN